MGCVWCTKSSPSARDRSGESSKEHVCWACANPVLLRQFQPILGPHVNPGKSIFIPLKNDSSYSCLCSQNNQFFIKSKRFVLSWVLLCFLCYELQSKNELCGKTFHLNKMLPVDVIFSVPPPPFWMKGCWNWFVSVELYNGSKLSKNCSGLWLTLLLTCVGATIVPDVKISSFFFPFFPMHVGCISHECY